MHSDRLRNRERDRDRDRERDWERDREEEDRDGERDGERRRERGNDRKRERDGDREGRDRIRDERRRKYHEESSEEDKNPRREAKRTKSEPLKEDPTLPIPIPDTSPDTNNTPAFHWKLKGNQASNPTGEDKQRTMKELEKLKKQREERDLQKRQWEEERTKQARLREQTYFGELSKKEDEFHLAQAKIRALTRLKERRGKPIDYFYVAITPSDLPFTICVPSPVKILQNLDKLSLQELCQEIPLFTKQNLTEEHAQYWSSLSLLIKHKLNQYGESGEIDEGLNSAVVADIDSILDGKSEAELSEMEQQITETISTGEAIDEEYWQSLLKRLRIRKSAARVEELYSKVFEQRIKQALSDGVISPDEVESFRKNGGLGTSSGFERVKGEEKKEPEKKGKKKGSQPTVVAAGNAFIRTVKKILTEDDMYELEESKGMEEDEEQFSQEFMLPPVQNADPSIPWVKPKYYNRVKTGYEWNKYNQIHYDVDSPPPKVVQGYKFSIFYPDLYDKSTTPTYRLIPTENPELMILHFKAGPPYLDIAFKIVNGEWEYSQKTGFKCMYSNGILYLWFNFKKYRYRR